MGLKLKFLKVLYLEIKLVLSCVLNFNWFLLFCICYESIVGIIAKLSSLVLLAKCTRLLYYKTIYAYDWINFCFLVLTKFNNKKQNVEFSCVLFLCSEYKNGMRLREKRNTEISLFLSIQFS